MEQYEFKKFINDNGKLSILTTCGKIITTGENYWGAVERMLKLTSEQIGDKLSSGELRDLAHRIKGTGVEKITHACVKTVDGTYIKAKHHEACFELGVLQGEEMSQKAEDKGFVTSFKRFVSNEEAFKIAIEAGQISSGLEQLWSQNEYFSDVGYVKI